jgi:hypothetical protein
VEGNLSPLGLTLLGTTIARDNRIDRPSNSPSYGLMTSLETTRKCYQPPKGQVMNVEEPDFMEPQGQWLLEKEDVFYGKEKKSNQRRKIFLTFCKIRPLMNKAAKVQKYPLFLVMEEWTKMT